MSKTLLFCTSSDSHRRACAHSYFKLTSAAFCSIPFFHLPTFLPTFQLFYLHHNARSLFKHIHSFLKEGFPGSIFCNLSQNLSVFSSACADILFNVISGRGGVFFPHDLYLHGDHGTFCTFFYSIYIRCSPVLPQLHFSIFQLQTTPTP